MLGELAAKPADLFADVAAHLVELGFGGRIVLEKFAGEADGSQGQAEDVLDLAFARRR